MNIYKVLENSNLIGFIFATNDDDVKEKLKDRSNITFELSLFNLSKEQQFLYDLMLIDLDVVL